MKAANFGHLFNIIYNNNQLYRVLQSISGSNGYQYGQITEE